MVEQVICAQLSRNVTGMREEETIAFDSEKVEKNPWAKALQKAGGYSFNVAVR